MTIPAGGVLRPSAELLSQLAPLGSLPAQRLHELAEVAEIERVPRGSDPLAARANRDQAVFLLAGEVLLMFAGGGTLVIVGATGDGQYSINRRSTPIARAKAITDVDVLALEERLLDIVVTFEELASSENVAASAMGQAVRADPNVARGIFSLANLRNGTFAQLPASRIEELLARFERIAARNGEAVIRQGGEGDYYYVIESGRCHVERIVGGVRVMLAELKSGDAFGEEALAADTTRNATVTMVTDGTLLRLAKKDFNELLREPLLRRVSRAEGRDRVARGALWLDVRYPSEYRHDRLAGALNMPLGELRNGFTVLDSGKEYIVYCQSGRRSSAATFLLAQRGFNVWLLDGGLREGKDC